MSYMLPSVPQPRRVNAREALLIASGDLRPAANATCWPAQRALESEARAAFESLGWTLTRAHPETRAPDGSRPEPEPHGFIASQAHGRAVFESIDPEAPLVVAEAVWQYSHHVLHGLIRHRGPILILANWSGQWPGLVGALNLRGSLTKAGVPHSFLWGDSFEDAGFRAKLRAWCETGRVEHDVSHALPLDMSALPRAERQLGEAVAADLRRRPAILGVFDEGCMGMHNAIVPDHLLAPCGVFKERLSQSALYFAMTQVSHGEAQAVRAWYDERGMRFNTGPNPQTDLTDDQIHEQCRMYIAAVRLADEFGCDAIGIQYQQGLKDLCPASDLVEGTLNCSERPPVKRADGSVIRDGEPITHFNEVDECAGLDGLITHRIWRAMGMTPDNTLHDVRWGDTDKSGTTDTYVWVLEISGSVPPSHFSTGWAEAVGERQPPMYFRLGGSTIKGVSKPGDVVWSRIYVDGLTEPGRSKLAMDIGRASAVALPAAETLRRLESTTPQWPIMHAVTHGVSRDQFMAKHQANHIHVVYADDAERADRALAAKAAAATAMGIRVHLCGTDATGTPLADRLRSLA
ncbi:MAG: fucose isomerase [Phycisphaeraceae bacterium]|nr:MAG: fucose isomerase [Phycisphaeraceae bacterium]